MRTRQIAFNGSLAAGTYLFAAGSYTHTSGTGSQVVALTGVLPGDNIQLTVQQADANTFSIQAIAGTNQFTANPNSAPAANCKVGYVIFR